MAKIIVSALTLVGIGLASMISVGAFVRAANAEEQVGTLCHWCLTNPEKSFPLAVPDSIYAVDNRSHNTPEGSRFSPKTNGLQNPLPPNLAGVEPGSDAPSPLNNKWNTKESGKDGFRKSPTGSTKTGDTKTTSTQEDPSKQPPLTSQSPSSQRCGEVEDRLSKTKDSAGTTLNLEQNSSKQYLESKPDSPSRSQKGNERFYDSQANRLPQSNSTQFPKSERSEPSRANPSAQTRTCYCDEPELAPISKLPQIFCSCPKGDSGSGEGH